MRRPFQPWLVAISALILANTLAYANSVNIVLTAAGPANDGVDYVLPYQLSINGVLTEADCYDLFDDVSVGEHWQASELTLNQVAQSGAFSGAAYDHGHTPLANYEEVAWLSFQSTPTTQAQVDLQHAIWNIFDPGTFGTTAGMQTYLTNWNNAYNAGFSTSYFDNYRFLEAASGTPRDGSFPQAFVFLTAGAQNNNGPVTPEPDSIVFLLIGLSVLSIAIFARHRARPQAATSVEESVAGGSAHAKK